MENFKYALEDSFVNVAMGRMDQNQDIFEKILENKVFGELVKELVMKKIYRKMNE